MHAKISSRLLSVFVAVFISITLTVIYTASVNAYYLENVFWPSNLNIHYQ